MHRILFILLGTTLSSAALAQCEIDVGVTDTIKFDLPGIEVPSSCETVTINLVHRGRMAANLMGHNWVLTRESDVQAVATAGMSAGLDGNYVPPDDDRVLAATEIIGGGESTSVSFSTAGLDPAGSYVFFCSFPGHWAVMRGSFRVI